MACETINVGGFTAIVCNRGRGGSRKRCRVTGCQKPATILCDFPLVGAKTGGSCSKPLCREHAVNQKNVIPFSSTLTVQLVPGGYPIEVTIPADADDTFDFCPAHDNLVVRKVAADG